MTGPRETAYDQHIAPLMTKIIALCKEHGIPHVATFELDVEEGHEDDDPMLCTTVLLDDKGPLLTRSPALLKASAVLRPKRTVAFAETIETLPDGSQRISIRQVL